VVFSFRPEEWKKGSFLELNRGSKAYQISHLNLPYKFTFRKDRKGFLKVYKAVQNKVRQRPQEKSTTQLTLVLPSFFEKQSLVLRY